MSQFISQAPELSIIIPTLNEAKSLPLLVGDLLRQKNIAIEIIVIDGGSTDGTCEQVKAIQYPEEVEVRLLRTSAGRALQMNEGAKLASSADLFFLHADSRIDIDILLANAKLLMQQKRKELNEDNIVGHFGLRFSRSNKKNHGAYYYYEAKTRLNRYDCVNGDQGLWLSRQYFHELGMFDESLPYLEDMRLVNRVFSEGYLVTLPGTLTTSARRFEMEGFSERQTLNALISNFEYIGMRHFFTKAKSVYQAQTATSKITLMPYFKIAHQTLFSKGVFKGFLNWYRTGRYVSLNAWQLAFALDCIRNRKSGLISGKGTTYWLNFYDRWIKLFVNSGLGNLIATFITIIWFYGYWLAFKDKNAS
ncbi:MAG: glycosyltransferase [Gammaproteobacteria bacterium]|nr:glycosyltransferase [Gammaproteobacteria bacterium]